MPEWLGRGANNDGFRSAIRSQSRMIQSSALRTSVSICWNIHNNTGVVKQGFVASDSRYDVKATFLENML